MNKDFDSWCQIMNSVDINDFLNALSQGMHFIQCICQTGFLPEPFTDKTKNFCNNTLKEIIQKMFIVAASCDSPESVDIFQHFYRSIIVIALGKFNTENTRFILLLYLFDYREEDEKNNQNLIIFLKNLLFSATSQLQQLIAAFSKYFPLALEEYATFYFLISKFESDFDFGFRADVLNATVPQFFNTLSMQKSTSLRSIPLNILAIMSGAFFHLYLSNDLNGEDLFPFFNFLRESLRCDILDKQLYGAHWFTNLYNNCNESCKNALIQWFVNNNFFPELVTNHPHIEVIKALITLFDVMSKEQLISNEIVYDLWQQSLAAAVSEREVYFLVIAHCLQSFDNLYLTQFLQTVDSTPNIGLLAHFYKTCCTEIGNEENDKILKDILNLVSQKVELPDFKKVFINLILLKDNFITKIINEYAIQWINQKFFHLSVYEIVSSLFKESKIQLNFNGDQFLKYIIEGFTKDKANSKVLFNLLFAFINHYHICLPTEANIELYKVSDKSYFWNFMTSLLNMDNFTAFQDHTNLVIYFINNEDIYEAGKEYVDFIIRYYLKFSISCDKSIKEISSEKCYCLLAPNDYLDYLFALCGVVKNKDCANTLTRFLLSLFLNSKMNFESKISFFVGQCIKIMKNNQERSNEISPQILHLLLSFIDSEEGKIDFRIFKVRRMKDSKKLFTISLLSPDNQEFQLRIVPQTSILAIRNVLSAYFSIPTDSISIEGEDNSKISVAYVNSDSKNGEVIDFQKFPVFLLSAPDNTFFLINLLQNKVASSVAYKLLSRFIYVPLEIDKSPNHYLDIFANSNPEYPFYFKYMTERFNTLIRFSNNLEQPEIFTQCFSVLMNIVLAKKFESRYLVPSLDILARFYNQKLNVNDIYKLLDIAIIDHKFLDYYLQLIVKVIPNEQKLVVNVNTLIKLTKLTTTNEIFSMFSQIIKQISSESSLYSLLISIITSPFSFSCCEEFIEEVVHNTLLKIPDSVAHITKQIIDSFDINQSSSIPILCKVLKALFSPEFNNGIDLTEFVTNLLINCAFSSNDEKLQKSIFDLSLKFNNELQDSFIMSCCSISSYKFNPNEFARPFKYISGLENLGCTCYMNSILQQLSSIKDVTATFSDQMQHLRSDILELLQLFSHMRFGMNKYYSTVKYCESYSKYNPDFNPREQEDAVEYFSMLLDACPKQTKELFQGEFKEIFSRGDINSKSDRLSERNEIFSTVGVTVAGIPDLSSSIHQLLAPEKLADDYVTETGQKVEACRYTRFHSLPRFLVFHLKRFEYNLYNFTRYKINSRFEFPTTLNMSEFSEEGTLYRLKGVVLHMGVAEGGHYVSVIRRDHKWILCDDSNIQELDEENFLNVAYGGDNDRNAYLLFFERDIENRNEISDTSLFKMLPEYLRNGIDSTNKSIMKDCSLLTKSCYDYFLNRIPSNITVYYFFNVLCHSNETSKIVEFCKKIENCKEYIVNSTSDLVDFLSKTINNEVTDSLIECVGRSTDTECVESILALSNKIISKSELLKRIGRIFEIAASRKHINKGGFELILTFINQISETKKGLKSIDISNYFEVLGYAPPSPKFEIHSIMQMVKNTTQTDIHLLSLLRLFFIRKTDEETIDGVLKKNKNLQIYKLISLLTLPNSFCEAMKTINNDKASAISVVSEMINLALNHSHVIKSAINSNHQIIFDLLLNSNFEVRNNSEALIVSLFSNQNHEIKKKKDGDFIIIPYEKNPPMICQDSQKLVDYLILNIPNLQKYEEIIIEESSEKDISPFKLIQYFRTIYWLVSCDGIRCSLSREIIEYLNNLISNYSEKSIFLNYNLFEVMKFLSCVGIRESDDLVVLTFFAFFNDDTLNCEPDLFKETINLVFPLIVKLQSHSPNVAENLLKSNQFIKICKRIVEFENYKKDQVLSNVYKFIKSISKHKEDYYQLFDNIFHYE